MKHKESPASLWLSEQSPAEQERLKKDNFERDQLRKLVNDELKRYGLLLTRMVVQNPMGYSTKFRTKNNAHILYGQTYGPSNNQGLIARPVLCEGSFQECCVVAARELDRLDAAQIPEGET